MRWRGWSAQPGCVSPCVAELFLQVGRLLHLASRGRLELVSLALGCRHAVLDRLAHRVVRVRHCVTGALRRGPRTLHRLAAAELDCFAAQAIDLLATRSRRDVRADGRTDEPTEQEPTKSAAAVSLVSHG